MKVTSLNLEEIMRNLFGRFYFHEIEPHKIDCEHVFEYISIGLWQIFYPPPFFYMHNMLFINKL